MTIRSASMHLKSFTHVSTFKQPKRRMKIAAHSVLYVLDWRECWERTEFSGTEPIRLILTFDIEYIFKKLRFRREDIVTITVNTERAVAISSRTGSLNWHHCCKFQLHECSSPVMIVSKMCVVSWSGWFRAVLFRTLRLPLSSCGELFATPQTLTFAVTLPRTSLYGVWFLEHIARPSATSSNKTVICSRQTLPFASSCVFGFPWFSKKWKSRRKSQNQQIFQCSRRLTASRRQKVRPISIEFLTLFEMHCG